MDSGLRRNDTVFMAACSPLIDAAMPFRDIALALGVVLIWGLNFVAIKWGVDEISPFLLTALRYLGCALPAVFFIRKPQVGWPILIAYGMTVGVLWAARCWCRC
jgi:drug/metabolite transporter (DMT)-like permease